MTRKLVWLALAILTLGAPWAVSAQDAGVVTTTTTGTAGSTGTGSSSTAMGSIGVKIVEVNGRNWTGGNSLAINKYDCKAGKITVQLTNIPSIVTYPYLEVWLKTGETDCQNGERKTAVVDTNRCQKISLDGNQGQLSGATYLNITFDLHQGICNGGGDDANGVKSVFFLALMSQDSAETTQAFGMLPLKIDTLPTDPATNLVAGSGETQIPLSWTLPGQMTSGYWVVLDTSGGTAGDDIDAGADAGDGSSECPSKLLKENTPFDPSITPPDGLIVKPHTDGTGHTVNINGEELGGRSVVAAAVSVMDQYGNASNFSNVACLRVVDTTGFWERYKANGGTADSGCACATVGARSATPRLVTALPVGLLLGFLAVRRRFRRRAR